MKKQILVSIIVPMFNAERFISETIESMIKQTYRNIEMVLVNDGSDDSTGDICREYTKKDDRIQYYEKSNSGVSDARNYGLDRVKGEYITFLDADDSLPNDAIEVFVSALQEENSDAVFAGNRNVYENTSVNRLMRLSNGLYAYEDLKDKLLDDGSLTGILLGSVWGACYKTAFLKEKQLRFRSEVKVNEDGLFNIEFIYNGGTVKIVDNIVYNYRQWKNSKKIPLQRDKRFESSEPTISHIIEQFGEKEIYDIQLKRRQVSVAFWNALRVQNADARHKNNLQYLKSLFEEENLQNCYIYLDYNKMNIVKKILSRFMKNRRIVLFYLSVKYISPVLSKVIRR